MLFNDPTYVHRDVTDDVLSAEMKWCNFPNGKAKLSNVVCGHWPAQ